MTDMLCATTSCSSRAIRSRSSATALLAACCCNRTTYSRRCRTEYPVIQAMTLASPTGTSSAGAPSVRLRAVPPMNTSRASASASAAPPVRLLLVTVTV